MRKNKDKREEFMELFGPCQGYLLKYLMKHTFRKDDAEDLFQDTVEIAYANFEQLEKKESFKSWMFKCARTAISKEYKKQKKRAKPMEEIEKMELSGRMFAVQPEGVEENLIRQFTSEMIRKHIATLSYTERVFISMRYYYELPYEEIAKQLDTTEQYLWVLNNRIIKKLRKKGVLKDEANGAE